MSSALSQSEHFPSQVGNYRIEEEIGSGAMGKVYRATHQVLGKEVAIKLLHAEDSNGELQARFVQEGIAASRVRHPNVVEIFDAGTVGATTFLAMQLLEGESLSECLTRQGRLPLTYAIDLILPVCAALMAAHDAGVLHRDLKPANIFLHEVGRGDPEPMLLDFGISKILGPVDAALTQNPRFLGTPFYLAPEQADGADATPRSDQYSLALTLYEMLLGVRPFERFRNSLIQLLRHVAEGDIRSPRELDASIADELDQAICRALSTDPSKRFSSVRDFGAALLPFASAPRRSIWQHSFIDAERTLTSVNAPVSDSRSSRRAEVSVDRSSTSSVLPRIDDAAVDPNAKEDDFLSHSLLFGAKGSDPAAMNQGRTFDPEESTVSVRSSPSDRLGRRWDSRDELSTQPDPSSKNSSSSLNAFRNPPPPRRFALLGVLLALSTGLGLGFLGWATWASPKKHEDATYSALVEVVPAGAQLTLDGQPMGTQRFEAAFRKDGTTHRIEARAPGYESTTILFVDRPPPRLISLRASSPTPEARLLPTPAPKKDAPEAAPSIDASFDSPSAPPRPRTQREARQGALVTSSNTLPSQQQEPEAPKREEPPPVVHPPTESPDSAGQSTIPTGNLDPWAE